MKPLLCLLMVVAIGCVTNASPGGDDDDNPPPPPPNETCLGGNNCVCPVAQSCNHTCSRGAAECHVQGGDSPVDVTCNENVECHVECTTAGSCEVECGGSADCRVSCPASGCTVTNCVGSECVVSCGGQGAGTRNGTTVTCP